jgi:Tfp pilus assembly protein FimT
VEIMVVIVIIAVLAGMITPRVVGSLRSAALRESAVRLRSALQYAHYYAVKRHCLCRLRLDAKGNQYVVEYQEDPVNEPDKFVPMQSFARRQELGEGVSFGQVRIERDDSRETQDMICFRPRGSADAAVLELTDGRAVYSIVIIPSSGRALLSEGRAQRFPTDQQDLDT